MTAKDANGNTVSGASVTLGHRHLCAGQAVAATQGSAQLHQQHGDHRCHRVAGFLGCDITGTAAAGTYSFSATSGGATSANSNTVSITAGTASALVFSTQPAGTVGEGANFTTQPVVTVEDANGNTVTGFGTGVTLNIATYTAGTSGGTTRGTLGCNNNTVTPTNGVATFAGCDISGTAAAGAYVFNATAAGPLTSANSGSVGITAGTVSALTFSTQPAGTVGETANFTTQPSVTAKDADGNTVSGASVTLGIATYAAGTSGGSTQGTLGCNNNTVTTGATGIAGFVGCDISGTAAAGTYSFSATSGGATSANSNTVSITAGTTATQLASRTQPAGPVAEGAASPRSRR